jgi:hypothetical protein
MHLVESLKPNVTRDAAVAQLRGSGLVRLLRWGSLGPLRSTAEVYVPFRIFRVKIDNGNGRQEKLLAIDILCGAFDLYALEDVPSPDRMIRVGSRNRPAPMLDDQRARDLLIERVRRLVYRQGFFRIRGLRIEAELVNRELHIPYWVGFFGFGERAHLSVLDGVRRRMEGAKVRHFLREWLASTTGRPPGSAGEAVEV